MTASRASGEAVDVGDGLHDDATRVLRRLEEAVALARDLAVRLAYASEHPTDRWLPPAVAAERLGVHRRWLDRRWRRLPYCHPLDPDEPAATGYRVSEVELAEHMRRRPR